MYNSKAGFEWSPFQVWWCTLFNSAIDQRLERLVLCIMRKTLGWQPTIHQCLQFHCSSCQSINTNIAIYEVYLSTWYINNVRVIHAQHAKTVVFFSADAQHGTYCWDLSVQLSICWLVTVMYCTETVKSNLTKSIFAFLWLSKAVTYLPVVTFCGLRQVSARAHALAKLCACVRPGSVPYKSSGCPRLWHLFSQSVRHFHSVSQHLLTST